MKFRYDDRKFENEYLKKVGKELAKIKVSFSGGEILKGGDVRGVNNGLSFDFILFLFYFFYFFFYFILVFIFTFLYFEQR